MVQIADWMQVRDESGFFGWKVLKLDRQPVCPMSVTCSAMGCRTTVPPDLESERLCLLHFTLNLEQECGQMRRETTHGKVNRQRVEEILRYIGERGEKLARVATSGAAQSDEIKSRILSTFLTLMNFRDNLDRSLQRTTSARGMLR